MTPTVYRPLYVGVQSVVYVMVLPRSDMLCACDVLYVNVTCDVPCSCCMSYVLQNKEPAGNQLYTESGPF